MQVGLFFELEVVESEYSEADIWHNSLAQTELAETLGFDSVWVVEHHFTPGYAHCSAPELFLTAASQRTRRIRLGSGVCLLPFEHPVRTAERFATLDLLSRGRLEFGVGRGVTRQEYETFWPGRFPNPRAANRDLFFESLDIIKRCWTETQFTHQGQYYQLNEPITVLPRPVQKPYPPIWAAAATPESYEAYPRMGMKILVSKTNKPTADLIPRIERYREVWAETPGNVGEPEVGCLVPVHCATTTAEAQANMRDRELWYQEIKARYFTPAPGGESASSPYQWWQSISWQSVLEKKLVVCGSPEDCIDQIRELEAAGITRLLAQFQVGGMPHAQVCASMSLFSEQVMPVISRRVAVG